MVRLALVRASALPCVYLPINPTSCPKREKKKKKKKKTSITDMLKRKNVIIFNAYLNPQKAEKEWKSKILAKIRAKIENRNRHNQC